MKKNNLKSSKLGWLFFGMLGFAAMALPSCNVGLGNSVDTEKPKVSLDDGLSAGMIIRDSFTLSGTCSDDGYISKVVIKFTNSSSGYEKEYVVVDDEIVPVENTTDKNGSGTGKKYTWKKEVNIYNEETGYDLPDGKYNISVKSYDRAETPKESLPTERSIIIDNTAPLMVLDRPSSEDTFGRSFKVKGKVADDSDVKSMKIDVYDEDGLTLLHTIWKTNIAPSFNIDAAVYGEADDNDDYEKIYGYEKDFTDKKFKCAVTLYDSSSKYPAENEEDKLGNYTSIYFLSEGDISNFSDFTMSDLHHIINGTYEPDSANEEYESLLEQKAEFLKFYNVNAQALKTLFSLNPENSPKFVPLRFKDSLINYDSFVKNEIADGEILSIQVMEGKDKIAINPDTIAITLYEVGEGTDGGWIIKESSAPVELVKAKKNEDGEVILDEAGIEEREKASFTQQQDNSWLVTTTVPKEKGLKFKSFYFISVTGFDTKGNKIDNIGKDYGFVFVSHAASPTIKLSGENVFYLNEEGIVTLSGLSHYELGKPEVKISIKIRNEDDTEDLIKSFVPELSSGEDNRYTFAREITKEDLAKAGVPADGQYEVYVEASSPEYPDLEPVIASITIIYDTELPEINDIRISPTVMEESASGELVYKLNDLVKVSVNFFDKVGLKAKSARYKFVNENKEVDGDLIDGSFVIDTKTLKQGKFDLQIEVEDMAGNKNEVSILAENGEEFVVDQESDKPKLILDNFYPEISEPSKINGNTAVAGTKLNGKITDDDGLKNITITFTDSTGTEQKNEISSSNGLKGSLNETYVLSSVTLPAKEGVYDLSITAEDIYGKKSNVWETKIKLTDKGPELSNLKIKYDSDKKNTLYSSTGSGEKTFTVEGNVSGEHNPLEPKEYLHVKVSESLATKIEDWAEIEGYAGEGHWEYEYTVGSNVPEGEYTLYFIAEDANGIYSTEGKVTYNIDNTAPVVSEVKVEPYTNELRTSVEVKISETNDKEFWYKVLEQSEAVPVVSEYAILSNVANGWTRGPSSSFMLDSLENSKKYRIYVIAVDKANNVSSIANGAFIVDTSEPVITEPVISDTDGIINLDEQKKEFSVSAAVTPGASGIKEVTLWNGDTKIGKMTEGSGEYRYTFAANTLTDETYSFVVKAESNSGLTGESPVKEISVDTEAPVISNIEIPHTVEVNGVKKVNGTVEVNFHVHDNKQLASSVAWSFGSGDGKSGTVDISENQEQDLSFEVDSTKLVKDENKLTLTLKDVAGNETKAEYNVIVDQETDRPEISVSYPATAREKDGRIIAGKNQDITFEVSDDDGLGTLNVTVKGSKEASPSVLDLDDFTPGETRYSFTVSKAVEDKYEVVISVTDIKGENTGYNSIIGEKVEVGFAGAVPHDLKFTSSENQIVKNNYALTVDGSFLGGDTTNLYRKIDDGSFTKVDFPDSVTLTTPADSSKTVVLTYKIENIFEENETKTFTYVIDNNAPVLSGFKVNNYDHNPNRFSEKNEVTINGTWTEEDSDSIKVEYWVLTENNPALCTGTPKTFSFQKSEDGWKYNFDLKELNQGANYLFIKSYDKVENARLSNSIKINVDSVPPNLSVKINEMPVAENSKIFVQDLSKVTFSGLLSDPAPSSGLSEFQAIRIFEGPIPAEKYPNWGVEMPSYAKGTDSKDVYIFKNEIAHSAGVEADGSFAINEGDGTETTNSAVKNKLSRDGSGKYKSSYTITVVGEDYKEHRAVVAFTLAQDNAKPKNPVINYPSGKKEKLALNASDFSSGSYSFGGNAEDNAGESGIKAVYYQVKKGKNLSNPGRYSEQNANGWTRQETTGAWSGELSAQTKGNRGRWTLFVYSEDAAGNLSDISKEEFDINYADPVITVEIDGVVNNDAEITTTNDFAFAATAVDEDQTENPAVTVKVDGKTGVASPITTDGLYNIEFSATDEVGNTTTETRTILRDSTPPSISISEDLSVWKTSLDFTVEANVSDNLSDVAAVYWTTDESAPQTNLSDLGNSKWKKFAGTTYEISGSDLSGKTRLKIAAADSLGNFGVFSSEVKIDTVAPVLKLYEDSAKTKELTSGTLISTNKTFDIYINGSDTGSGIASVTVNDISLSETSKGSNLYKYTVPATVGTNTYDVVVTDNAGNVTPGNLSVFIDTKEPEIKGFTPSSTASIEGDEKEYINGSISFDIEVSDDQNLGKTNALTYKIQDSAGKSTTGNITLTKTTNETVRIANIDTTEYADGKCTVTVTVKDFCGNEKTVVFDDLYINQNTDKPVLITSNATNEDGKKNVFGMGDMVINAQITDDDGIAKVEYQMQNKDVEPVEAKYVNFPLSGTSTQIDFAFTIPSEIAGVKVNGEKVLYVRIKDTEGKPNGTQVISVPFSVDNQVPVLTPKTVNGTGYQSGMFVKENFSIVLEADDDNNIVSVKRTSPLGSDGKPVEIELNDLTLTYTDEITGAAEANDQSREYVVTDEFGREGTLVIRYSVDKTKPAVEGVRFAVTDGKTEKTSLDVPKVWFTTGNINVLARTNEAVAEKKYAVSDKNLRGQVSYELVNTNPEDSDVKTTDRGSFNIAPEDVKDESGNVILKYGELDDKISLSEGTTNAKYTFVDAAGNESPISFDINVDTEVPVKTGSSMEYGSVSDQGVYTKKADLSSTSVVGAAAEIRVLISAKDSVSGIKKIHIGTSSGFAPEGSEEITCKSLTAISASGELERYNKTLADEVVTIDNTILRDGTVNLYVRFEDAAGNVSDADYIGSFIYDTKAPEVTITSHADGNTVNGKLTLKGNVVEDNLASDAVPVLYVDGKETSATPNLTGVLWTLSEIDTTVSAIGDGDHTFVVAFTDKAGNTTEASAKNTVSLKVDQDSDKPVIKLDELYTGSGLIRTIDSTTFTGSVTDDDGPIDTDKFFVSVTSASEEKAGTYSAPASFNGSTFTVNITSFVTKDKDTGYDNEYKVWFKVTDKMGTEFDSSNATKPKVLGKTTEEVTSAETEGPVLFNIDQGSPVIEETFISYSKDESGNAVWEEFKSNGWYGGKLKGTAQLRIKASDTITTDPEKLTVQIETDPVIEYTKDPYNGGYHYYTFDFSKVPDGLLLVTINVSDASKHPKTKRINVNIDNTAPKGIDHIVPSADSEQTSDFTLKGDVSDGSGYGIQKMEYCVPVAKEPAPVLPANESADTEITWIAENDRDAYSILTREENSTVWSIEFKDLHDNVNLAQINSSYAGYVIGTSDVYSIPVWFKITDKLGNVKYASHTIKYNPNFDKPKIAITSPKHDKNVGDVSTGKPYKVLGGTLHITGTASDNDGISAVYLQFDIDGDGDYDAKDKEKFEKWGIDEETNQPIPHPDFRDSPVAGIEWGILASGTRGWNAEFDSSELDNWEELQIGNDANATNKTLNIRAAAVDTDPNDQIQASNWSDEIHVSVNNNVPLLEDFKVVQYSDSSFTNKVHDEPYVSGMYINKKGYWRLEGIAYANSGISRLVFNDGTEKVFVKGSSTPSETTASQFVGEISETTAKGYEKGYKVIVPLSNSLNMTVTAYDGANLDTPQNFVINVDGDKPEFKGGSNADDLVIYRDVYGESDKKLSDKIEIRNYNNNTVTIASKAKDTGSGFDKAVFFVSRKNEKNVYNFMEEYGANRTANKTTYTDGIYNISTGSLNSGKSEPATLFLNQDGIPVLKFTVTRGSNKRTVVASGTGVHQNKNIRTGGLVYIGGAYHVIDTVDRVTPNQITVTLKEDVDTSYTTAYFVYAMAVDHEGESLNTSDSSIIDNDDEDGMLEKITVNGTETTWQAVFNSANIPDGPVDVHVVVFDKAGNARQGTITTRVSNNKPKIARVTLGTDLDGSGKIGNITSETKTFYATAYAASDEDKDSYKAGVEVWNLNEDTDSSIKNWKIKKNFEVTPEFVGGTDNIFYIFETEAGSSGNLTAAASADFYPEVDGEKTEVSGSSDVKGKLSRNSTSGKVEGTITLDNTLLTAADTTDQAVNRYSFSFWDETEGSTPGVDSGSCVLNINIGQKKNDSNRPEGYIHPFFWKANGGKSSSSSSVSADNSVQWKEEKNKEVALGHIELTEDLTETTATTYGTEPKVSGKIVLRGTVYDDTRIEEIKITSSDNFIIGASGITATRSKGWANKEGLTVTDDNGIQMDGHLIEWTLLVDTEKASSMTAQNITFAVTASDGTYSDKTEIGANLANQTGWAEVVYATAVQAGDGLYYETAAKAVSGEDPVDLTNHKPVRFNIADAANKVYEYKYGTHGVYQMDVVPYVTSVSTSLSSMDGAVPGKYSRSARGHYAVQSVASNFASGKNPMNHKTSETVTLYGFNLNGDSVTVNGSATSGKTAASDSALSSISFSTASLASGAATVVVDGITAMNNLNKNEASGSISNASYTDKYNYQGNGINNNILTDDLVFDVWEFNDRVAIPAKSSLGGTVMKINSGNGLIQYAYSDGVFLVMGNGYPRTNTSAQKWVFGYDTYQEPAIGFHIDQLGRTYASGHSSDTNNVGRVDVAKLTASHWGNGPDIGNYDRTSNNICIETLGERGVIERQRIWSPTFASTSATVNGTNSVNLYMAYYDLLNKEIRFRAGFVPASNEAFGMFGRGPTTNGTSYGNDTYDLKKAQVIACAPGSTNSTVNNDGTRGSSEFVSVAARKVGDNDLVFIVWYDSYTSTLRYAYQSRPNNAAGTAVTWSNFGTLFSGGGKYCQAAFDKEGGLHVAAFAGSDHVYYAYSKAFTGADATHGPSFVECRVDATDSVGQNLTLDVAYDNGHPVPYIGYKSTTGYPKYAHYSTAAAVQLDADDAKTETIQGVDEKGRYTGNWEVTIVPTPNAIYLNPEDKVNVGVWKDAGVLRDSKIPTGTNAGKVGNSTGANDGTSTTYGNGTSNGVLVYQIVDSTGTYVDCLESAQIR